MADNDAPGAGPVWILGAQLTGFVKRTFIHCDTQNVEALGLVVSGKNIFLCLSHCKSMGANDSRGGAIFNPGAWLAGIIKEITTHWYIQNMKALGPLDFGEIFNVFFFFMTPLGSGLYGPQGHV